MDGQDGGFLLEEPVQQQGEVLDAGAGGEEDDGLVLNAHLLLAHEGHEVGELLLRLIGHEEVVVEGGRRRLVRLGGGAAAGLVLLGLDGDEDWIPKAGA